MKGVWILWGFFAISSNYVFLSFNLNYILLEPLLHWLLKKLQLKLLNLLSIWHSREFHLTHYPNFITFVFQSSNLHMTHFITLFNFSVKKIDMLLLPRNMLTVMYLEILIMMHNHSSSDIAKQCHGSFTLLT